VATNPAIASRAAVKVFVVVFISVLLHVSMLKTILRHAMHVGTVSDSSCGISHVTDVRAGRDRRSLRRALFCCKLPRVMDALNATIEEFATHIECHCPR
jgi:hypothetical protein